MVTDLVIRCTGRLLDTGGKPVGGACGRQFKRPSGMRGLAEWPPVGVWVPTWPTPVDDDTYRQHARAAGWAIGGPDEVMCPRCRRVDPDVAKLAADLERSVRR